MPVVTSISVFSHWNIGDFSDGDAGLPDRRRSANPHTTRTMDSARSSHETICCVARGEVNQCVAFMTISARIASKAKKRGKPCDRGWLSDALDVQAIATDPAMNTTLDSTVQELQG